MLTRQKMRGNLVEGGYNHVLKEEKGIADNRLAEIFVGAEKNGLNREQYIQLYTNLPMEQRVCDLRGHECAILKLV